MGVKNLVMQSVMSQDAAAIMQVIFNKSDHMPEVQYHAAGKTLT